MIYVIARMEILPGCMKKIQEVLEVTVPQVLAEDGCIQYTPCIDYEGDTEKFITIVEAWENREKHKAHLAAPHMAAFREAVKDLRKGCDVSIVSPIK